MKRNRRCLNVETEKIPIGKNVTDLSPDECYFCKMKRKQTKRKITYGHT